MADANMFIVGDAGEIKATARRLMCLSYDVTAEYQLPAEGISDEEASEWTLGAYQPIQSRPWLIRQHP